MDNHRAKRLAEIIVSGMLAGEAWAWELGLAAVWPVLQRRGAHSGVAIR